MYPYTCDISASMHVTQRAQSFYILASAAQLTIQSFSLSPLCLCGE